MGRVPRHRGTNGKGQVGLYSRRHNDFRKRFPLIVDALAELKSEAILDGEICALDEQGHPRFEWLVNRGRSKGRWSITSSIC